MINSNQVNVARHRLARAKERLKSALDLLNSQHYADSVSRSYYAVFTAARAFLALKSLDSKRHSGVIALFNQHFVATGVMSKESGRILGTAKSFRERADYADFLEVTEEDARQEVENARKFVAEAEERLEQLIREQA